MHSEPKQYYQKAALSGTRQSPGKPVCELPLRHMSLHVSNRSYCCCCLVELEFWKLSIQCSARFTDCIFKTLIQWHGDNSLLPLKHWSRFDLLRCLCHLSTRLFHNNFIFKWCPNSAPRKAIIKMFQEMKIGTFMRCKEFQDLCGTLEYWFMEERENECLYTYSY